MDSKKDLEGNRKTMFINIINIRTNDCVREVTIYIQDEKKWINR